MSFDLVAIQVSPRWGFRVRGLALLYTCRPAGASDV